MDTYKAILQNKTGRIIFTLRATTKARAITKICNLENCKPSAITSINLF